MNPELEFYRTYNNNYNQYGKRLREEISNRQSHHNIIEESTVYLGPDKHKKHPRLSMVTQASEKPSTISNNRRPSFPDEVCSYYHYILLFPNRFLSLLFLSFMGLKKTCCNNLQASKRRLKSKPRTLSRYSRNIRSNGFSQPK